jgi:monofunctional glycosyltransferase
MARRKRRTKSKKHTKRRLLTWVLVILLIGIASGVVYVSLYPDVSKLQRTNPKKTAFMEHREKEWREQGKRLKIQQGWVPLSRVSDYVKRAVLIAEDDKFWRHEGFDFDAIQKAVERDLKEGKFKFGGSTVTQQLAKNLYLSPSKNPIRKVREAIITWRMERALSKRRILELYLNVVEWGEAIFGIEAAARHYYGKPAADITPEEAARLAAVLPNPIKYKVNGRSPYVERRTALIYSIMVKRGVVIPMYDELKEPAPSDEGLESQTSPGGSEDAAKKNLQAGEGG